MNKKLQELENRLKKLAADEISRERVDLLNSYARELAIQDPKKALKMSKQSEKISRKLNYQQGIVYSTGLKGFAHYMMSDLEEALKLFTNALNMINKIEPQEVKADIYGGLAAVQLSLGNYEEALSNQLKALKLVQKSNDKLSEAWGLQGLGMGYHEWGEHTKALQYHRRSLKTFKSLDKKYDIKDVEVGMARALTGIGTVYQSLGKYREALKYHQKSLPLFEKHQNHIGTSRALNDLGTVLQNLGEYDQALEYHQKSLKIRQKIGNKQSQCTSLINLGRLFIQLNQPHEALNVLHRALTLAGEIKAKPRVYQSHQALSEAYGQMQNFEESLKHYKIFHQTKEEVSGDEARAKLKNMQIGFEVEKAEHEADIIRLKNIELQKKNNQLKKLLKELKEAQSQLIQSEKMAALGNLVAGVVHEINSPVGAFNSSADVTVRSMQTIKNVMKSVKSIKELKESKSFRRAFDVLEQNARVGLSASRRVSKMVQSLKSFARIDESPFQEADLNKGLETTLTLLEHEIGPDVKVKTTFGNIPRIDCYPAELNQVFMNLLMNALQAIKGKGVINIETHTANGSIVIRISDTGTGIPKHQLKKIFEPGFSRKGTRVKAGTGLFSVYNIIQKHNGQIKADSKPGHSSTFTLILPLN